MIGKIFGQLTVVSKAPKRLHLKNKAHRYECICICGKRVEVNGGALRFGHVKSCGCSRKNFSDRPAFKQLFANYRCQAEARDLQFELTIEEFEKLTLGPCFYCGAERTRTAKKRNSSYQYNGVDRYDNDKGYIIENCVSACGTHNHMKCDRSHEEFVAACRAVVNHFSVTKTVGSNPT